MDPVTGLPLGILGISHKSKNEHSLNRQQVYPKTQGDSSSFGNNYDSMLRDCAGRESKGGHGTGFIVDDMSQMSAQTRSNKKQNSLIANCQGRFLEVYQTGSPIMKNQKSPITCKEIVRQLDSQRCVSRSTTRVENKTNSRNDDLVLQNLYHGLSAQEQTMQKNCMEFEIREVSHCANRPCCKGRTSYIASHHTSLNLSRKTSRRNSRNLLSTTFMKGQ